MFVYSLEVSSPYDHGGLGLPAWAMGVPLILAMLSFLLFTRWPSNSCTSTMYLLKIGGIVLRAALLLTLFGKVSFYPEMELISLFW